MKDLMDMVKKKKGEPLAPNYKKAKMGVLKEISDMAGNDMGEGIKGLKKVTVASDDKEGLEHGLDLAKKLAAKGPAGVDQDAHAASEDAPDDVKDMEDANEDADEGSHAAGPADDSDIEHEIETDHMDDAEIDAMIKLLQSKKKGS